MARLAAAVLILPLLAHGEEKVLKGHSINAIPDINHLASMWELTGTIMPSHRSLILTPGVADRIGTVFSKTPLTSNDFSASFVFTAKPKEPGQFDNDGLAFWILEENPKDSLGDPSSKHVHNQDELIAGTWRTNYGKAGFDLLGYKNNFKGLGVFFLNDKGGQTVSAKVNDGSMSPAIGNGIPDPNHQIKLDYQAGDDINVDIRVRPDKVEIVVKGQTISVDTQTKPNTGYYIGFSCYGGVKESYNPVKERSAVVELKGLTVKNFGSGEGEDLSIVQEVKPQKVPEEDKEDVLAAHSSFKDHRDESFAIKELSNMVFKLVVETKPQREQMKSAIFQLGKRVETLEQTFKLLKAEIDKKTGHKLSEEFEALKKDLMDIHSAAHKDNADRGKKLESLHADIQTAHKNAGSGADIGGHLDTLSQSNAKVIDQLTSEHQRNFGVSIFAIAFIIIAGLSLYNKFRCWEKKHVL